MTETSPDTPLLFPASPSEIASVPIFSRSIRLVLDLQSFSNFSTNVQFAWAINAGLISELPVAAVAMQRWGPVGGLPSMEISLVRHFATPATKPLVLTRRRLFPLCFF